MKIAKLIRKTKVSHPSDRYDLEVEDNNNFFANGLLVHNSCTVFTRVVEEDNRAFFGHWLVTSKGQGGDKGLALYDNEKNRTSNVYVHVFLTNGMAEKFERAAEVLGITGQFTVFGETFGSGVQDLTYGATNGEKLFRGFDVYVGCAPMGRYLNLDEKKAFFEAADVPMVPVLYRGPFSVEAMKLYTDGKETVSGREACIREGIVIRVAQERYEADIGRVMLKSVSAAYLTRKGGTEFT